MATTPQLGETIRVRPIPATTWMGLAITAGAAALVCTVAAAARAPALKTPPTVQAVIDCRAIAAADARLACYDRTAATLDKAETSGEVVSIDRAQRRAARRQAFGLPLPSLAFLERGEKPGEASRLEAKIASASQSGYGRWTVVLEGGAVWTQTDENVLFHRPHPGSTADIRKGVLGSFFMKIDGQQAIRVRRVQ